MIKIDIDLNSNLYDDPISDCDYYQCHDHNVHNERWDIENQCIDRFIYTFPQVSQVCINFIQKKTESFYTLCKKKLIIRNGKLQI